MRLHLANGRMSSLVSIIGYLLKVFHSPKSLKAIFLITLVAVCFIVWIRRQVKFHSWTDVGCRSTSRSTTQEVNDVLMHTVDGNGHRCITFEYEANVDNKSVRGKPFVMDATALANLGFPIDIGEDTLPNNVQDFVIVTAADYNYLHIAMDAIGLVQLNLPTHRILFYDLSPDLTSVAVIEKVKRLCNVDYVAFDYSLYPLHVRNRENYAWKPLIIHEVLRKHKAVLWMDSSIRVHPGSWNDVVHNALSKGGIVMFGSTYHSIFSATHSRVYDYLPLGRFQASQTMMTGASSMFVFLNKQNYDGVIRWSFLCALFADCIAPTTDLHCKFAKGDKRDSTYAKCHRYDQSVFNVLLLNHLKQKTTDNKATIGDISKQFMVEAPLAAVRRERHNGPLLTCSDDRLVATPSGRVMHVDDYLPSEIFYKISSFVVQFV